MRFCCLRLIFLVFSTMLAACAVQAQAPSSSSKHGKTSAAPAGSPLDAGTITSGVYRNAVFGFSCKIPAGWVLRTDEMNAPEENESAPAEKGKSDTKPPDPSEAQNKSRPAVDRTAEGGCPHTGCGCSNTGCVLLAAFSRPPQAAGSDVNASIVIAAESVSAYPGLKEAAQYFGPLTEVAKAQGFTVDQEPYETAVGAQTLVRADYHKDVGTRVLRQSTLVVMARGYAVSFTVIGGTEDEVEDLVEGLSFAAGAKTGK